MNNLQIPEQLRSLQTSADPLTVARNRFSEIELTELEREEALAEARKRKHQREKSIAYWGKVNEEKKMVKYTAEQAYYSIKSRLGRLSKYQEYEGYNDIVMILCEYFTNDESFELNEPYKLSKGLMLMGGVGVGKTTLLKLFRYNPKQSFMVDSARELADRCNALSSKEPITELTKNLTDYIAKNEFGQEAVGLMLDDIGTEDLLKLYGNDCQPVAELMEAYYRQFLNGSERVLHVTTNLTPDQLQAKYGTRVYSRMKEMFNVISFPDNAPDLRA